MQRAFIGLSLALALFIIAQGVNKPVLFYALVIPLIVFLYGVRAKEALPEIKVDNEDTTADEKYG